MVMAPRPIQAFHRNTLPAAFLALEIVSVTRDGYEEAHISEQAVPLTHWEWPTGVFEKIMTADGRTFRSDERAEYEALVAAVSPFGLSPTEEILMPFARASADLVLAKGLRFNAACRQTEVEADKAHRWPAGVAPGRGNMPNRTHRNLTVRLVDEARRKR
jgi:hypothetical protein